MSSSLTLFSFFAVTFLYTSSHSFNITNILNQHNDFSKFNNLLTQTQLASTINNRQPITVLAVSNDVMSALVPGRPLDVIKKILSLHIVLDYYDEKKLKSLNGKSVILTTLFQSSGQAQGQQGFLNATVLKNGDVLIGSAGSSVQTQVVESVMSQPFNISVLHISSAIMINVRPENGPPFTPPPRSAPPPNDDDYDYDEPPSPPSPHSSAPGAGPLKATAKTSSASGVSGINSHPAFAFALVITSILWFMT
ncbi:Fasciclin-like arabinogalactan protein 14 [Cardamine amara subsp. amara]|uniref:Fasciclin-like arabinogalactan protein 14 n=1 Tax=Cardamine amara subsp. amara TaxID=228776 RepID=A0ABD1ADB9_CARAN